MSPQSMAIFSKTADDFDYISVTHGDHLSRQNRIIMIHILGTQMWNVNSLKNGIVDTD
jgi:hypothetical protein